MKKVMLALALGSTMIAGTACAQEGPRRGGMGLMRADADGDGTITRAEYQAEVDGRFARMDANGNGVLDPGGGPMRRMGRTDGPPPPPPAMAGKDRPVPPKGPISRDDFRARALSRFDRIDTNHDGKLDRAEMATMRDAMRDRRGGDTPPPQTEE